MTTQSPLPDLLFLDAPVPVSGAPTAAVASSPTYELPRLPPSVVGWGAQRLLGVWLSGLEAWCLLRAPGRAAPLATGVAALQRVYYGELRPLKTARVAGRAYREFHAPGWPGLAYRRYVAAVLDRVRPAGPGREAGQPGALHTVFLAITKKCPLACAHCFEWDALNQREKLSRADLHELVARFQARGATQIFFTGGEPMLRVADLRAVLAAARPGTDFWVFTSGFHFTPENARQLRAAGLTGVCVSLDHHEPAAHNAFRGQAGAYENALRAVVSARQAGLVVNLSLCATREFTTADNLAAYARLARRLGVAFVQLLEPRAVGHFAGQDVALRPEQLALLEDFYRKMSYDPAYGDYPIVHYYGYHQRRMGCSGAADRFVYVDTDGDLHACPFCQRKTGSALGPDFDQALARVRAGRCGAFAQAAV